MDLLTHALVGAAAGAATQPPQNMRLGAVAGATAALAVDLDYFIGSSADPLLHIEFHRHFSHSILFIPIGAALVALLLWPLLRHRLGARHLYCAALAGYATHWMVDVCTSYGVHVLWPFSDQRIALDLLSVIDPVFTLAVGLPTAFALWRRQHRGLGVMLLLALAYLGFSAWQQRQASMLVAQWAIDRGHQPEELLLRPSFGNTLLWRSTYRHQDAWHIDAVRPGLLTEPKLYGGGTVLVFDHERDLPQIPPDSRIGRDIRRLERLSEGFLVWTAGADQGKGRLGDIRFSVVPTGTQPMWGLEFDPARPDAVPNWFIDRRLTPAMRQRFLDQLLGRPHSIAESEAADNESGT